MNIASIIPAAGLSSRMGAFKPLLPVGGRPAILRCINAAEAAGVRDVAVVTGYNGEELESVLSMEAPGAIIVRNPRYAEEMLLSVFAGVSALPGDVDGFFLQPADCCAVCAETLAALIRAFEEADATSVVYPAYRGERGHPPLIPAKHIGAITSRAGNARDDCGLRGILSSLPFAETEVGDSGVLMDMDSPGDYEAMVEHVMKRSL